LTSSEGIVVPSAAHLQWHEDNVGAIIHFTMQTFVSPKDRRCPKTFDPDLYNPAKLSTDQWVQAAVSFGAKYVVFVVDHFDGFSPYPTSGKCPV